MSNHSHTTTSQSNINNKWNISNTDSNDIGEINMKDNHLYNDNLNNCIEREIYVNSCRKLAINYSQRHNSLLICYEIYSVTHFTNTYYFNFNLNSLKFLTNQYHQHKHLLSLLFFSLDLFSWSKIKHLQFSIYQQSSLSINFLNYLLNLPLLLARMKRLLSFWKYTFRRLLLVNKCFPMSHEGLFGLLSALKSWLVVVFFSFLPCFMFWNCSLLFFFFFCKSYANVNMTRMAKNSNVNANTTK